MKKFIDFYFSDKHARLEWLCIKILLIGYWLKTVLVQINTFKEIQIPIGICKIIPCDFFTNSWVSLFCVILILTFSIFYIFEKRMLLTTLIIFSMSLLFFTIEESNGIFERRGLYTFLFFAQFIAYLFTSLKLPVFNLEKYRIQFSVQVIAIGYTLSGLSKLYNSDIFWITDGTRMPLQILKSFYSNYTDNGETVFLNQGNEIAQFMDSHPYLIYFVLTTSLIFELGAFSVIFFSRKYILVYGILLYCMHLGIYAVMKIEILSIMLPMIILFINPLFIGLMILYFIYLKYKKKEIKTL